MDSGDRQASAKMGEGAGGRRASAISCGLHRLAEALGDRAHDRVDYAQPKDEPRLRVLVGDDGGSDLRGDDPSDAQKARQRSIMRASQTPSKRIYTFFSERAPRLVEPFTMSFGRAITPLWRGPSLCPCWPGSDTKSV